MASRRLVAAILLLALIALGDIGAAAQKETDKPVFLVARSELADPLFRQSVVLMLPASGAGTDLVIGLIVNKPTRLTLHELFPHDSALRDRTETIYFGGPVDIQSPTIVFRSRKSSKQSIHVLGDLYASFDSHFIEDMLKKPEKDQDVRLFQGRAQWAPDQLQEEVLRKAWYSERAESSWIFSREPGIVWHSLLDRMQLGPVAQISNEPDPVFSAWSTGLGGGSDTRIPSSRTDRAGDLPFKQ